MIWSIEDYEVYVLVPIESRNHDKQHVFKRSLLRKEASKYPWLSIYIHDPMMKGRSWNLQGMDPRDKVKHEEEHEYSKKERKGQNNQFILYRESQRLPSWFELTKKKSSRRNESYDKEQSAKEL
jgi:hypothetical protein